MLFRILRKARELIKEETQFKKDLRRLQMAALDYDALQRMIDNVAIKNVEIEIQFLGETPGKLIIKPKTPNEIGFQSFADRYKDARK